MPQESVSVSYFLISYPHTERHGERSELGSERDPDYWVIKFYDDLCRHVEELAAVPAGTRVGILDRAWWVENDWTAGLPAALVSCRVLVPLYSPRYFQSEVCGQEWQVFADRPASQRAEVKQGPAIVPVMWMPMPSGSLHPAARTVPIEYGGVDSYALYGLYGIIKRSEYRADYEKSVRWIAEQVVATAKRSPATQRPTVDLVSQPNAFTPAGAPEPGVPRLLITAVAPQSDDLPPGRGGRYYGKAAWDWTPYRPTSEQERAQLSIAELDRARQAIARFTANFTRGLGYRPYVCDLREREADLIAYRRATHPELLIIDPWAVMRPECHRLLGRFNLAEKPWVQVAIPWNPADDETAAAESQLRRALDSALGRKLEFGRVTSGIAVGGVPGIAEFGAVLPSLIPTVGNRYLGHAPAFPPGGSVVEKPTLHWPTSDPPNPLERAGA